MCTCSLVSASNLIRLYMQHIVWEDIQMIPVIAMLQHVRGTSEPVKITQTVNED